VDLAFRPGDVRGVSGVRFSGSARHARISVGIGRADAAGPGRAGQAPRDSARAPSRGAGGAERRALRPPTMALLRARAQAIGQGAQAEAGGADAPCARGERGRRRIGARRRCRSDLDRRRWRCRRRGREERITSDRPIRGGRERHSGERGFVGRLLRNDRKIVRIEGALRFGHHTRRSRVGRRTVKLREREVRIRVRSHGHIFQRLRVDPQVAGVDRIRTRGAYSATGARCQTPWRAWWCADAPADRTPLTRRSP
jgi:hypothetical protein